LKSRLRINRGFQGRSLFRPRKQSEATWLWPSSNHNWQPAFQGRTLYSSPIHSVSS